MPRRTKIVATLGPSTQSEEKIAALIQAGVNVVRLNFSHGDHDSHRATIARVRQVAETLGATVGILQDLGGPKIRLGEVPGGEVVLEPGQAVCLAPTGQAPAGALPVGYPWLTEDVSAGERILLADGLVELVVEKVTGAAVCCRVLVGGRLSSHKGVNLPSSNLRVPAFTDKDAADLEVGLAAGVDFVALSFVRHEDDLKALRQRLAHAENRPLLIAKIEKPQAVERLPQILALVDGVMVARGDLGVEMHLEEVPLIQKRIIVLARRAAKPVITATQMLRSMMDSPRPTRAEAADVANAVLDGTDAVMLSDETAVGDYPAEAVATLDRIARATEGALASHAFLEEEPAPALAATEGAISRAVCLLARDLNAAAIVAGTVSGSSPRLVARFRPPTPVVALTSRPQTQRQLALSWGVIPLASPHCATTEQLFATAEREVREHGLAGSGDRVIITAGVPMWTSGTTNLVKVMDLD